ncbi:penicillin-binding transpeptidase domain-containing protein, partial [Streptomyces sp. NPDC127079]|uniref:penicillin-binding transpeptidase domain-containing protein n=1 Tax=Streptomyces sp. NPDC127079 TaxID=3347132 RepID=UPI0036605E02
MRKGVKAAIVGSVCTVVVGGAGYGAYNVLGALRGDSTPAVRTGPPTEDEIKDTTQKFFTAWEKGRSVEAASFTNNSADAEPVLTSFSATAHIKDVHITPGEAHGATVPFGVRATVTYGGKSKPLAYQSSLRIVRGQTTHRALVDWQPSVVHPQLRRGDTLATGEAASPPIEAVDREGKVLTKDAYPSLGPVLDELRSRYGDKTGGTPGVELVIHHASQEAADTTLLTLAEGRSGKLRTTLDARVQAAAETAVTKYAESSVVAVEPSTGEVLAVANNRVDGFNAAFLGELAPGSTMKIISAATLIDTGLTTSTGPAPCPPTATWQSQTFSNLKGLRPDEKATLSDSFARSCNTAFVMYAETVQV